MTTAITGTSTPYRVSPYITVEEFKQAPTGVDLGNLEIGGVQDQQDARLGEAIARASGWVDRMCDQVLAATLDTENGKLRANGRGEIFVKPKYRPVLQVTDFRYGSVPSSLNPLSDLSNVFVEEHGFTVASPGFGMGSSAGPLQFGPVWGGGNQVFAQWSYVNGYANTVLASPVTAGSSVVTLVDSTGVFPNLTRLTLFDGSNISAGPPSQTERGLVVTLVVGNVVTLGSPLAFDHKAGVSISALPDDVKQACILLTKALIGTRGTEALISDDIAGGPHHVASMGGIDEEDVAIAAELLAPFARVR